MISRVKILIVFLCACLSLTACNDSAMIKSARNEPDKLQIYSDGKMIFKDRIMPSEDVIIYPDGFGGEKAAVKLYTPFHPPFYRDHIVVERLGTKS